MTAKLFIGSLDNSVTEHDLRTLLAQEGEIVSIRMITDKATGQSKGIALVEMATEHGANKVIRNYHGREVQGRLMTVNVARDSSGQPSFKIKRKF